MKKPNTDICQSFQASTAHDVGRRALNEALKQSQGHKHLDHILALGEERPRVVGGFSSQKGRVGDGESYVCSYVRDRKLKPE